MRLVRALAKHLHKCTSVSHSSIIVLVWYGAIYGPKQRSSNGYAKAKRFLSHRVADRRGDHSNHRGDRNPELDQVQDGVKRSGGSWRPSYVDHCGNRLCDGLPEHWLYRSFG